MSDLTRGECRALQAMADRGTVKLAAGSLSVKPETIKTQLARARFKLNAHNTTHAVAIAIREGVIQ